MHLCRRLAWWILLIAWPIQGYAAAAKLHCTPGSGPAVQALHHLASAAEHHGHHAGNHPLAAHHEKAPPSSDELPAKAPDAGQHDTARCSACALCCGGLALPSIVAAMPQSAASFHFPPGVTAPVAGVVAPRLERPPTPFEA